MQSRDSGVWLRHVRVLETVVVRRFLECRSEGLPFLLGLSIISPCRTPQKPATMEGMKRALILLLVAPGCTESVPLLDPIERIALEEMRWKGEAPTDPTNGVFEDVEAQEFGKALFYDRRLSANGELSCGTCHQPEQGFADGRVIAEGIGVAARHTPSLMGAAHQDWYLWDGGCDSLWCQGVGPMENPSEMAFTRAQLAHLIHDDPDYRESYEEIFGELPDLEDTSRFPEVARPNWSDEESSEHLAWMAMTESDQVALNRVLTNSMKALGAFQGLIDRVGSAFDMFGEAVAEDNPIGQALYDRDALAGFKLFVGEAGCVSCHSGPRLSDGQFYNSGVGDREWLTEPDEGRIEGVLDVLEDPFNSAGLYSDDPTGDRALRLDRLESLESQRGAFRVPSLRNVALTPPYMHGGQHASLQEVIEHYDSLTETPREGETDSRLVPLQLTPGEKESLLAFLESLTGVWMEPDVLPPEGWTP